ncbi:hypothetical protein ACFYO2_19505 [Streptomyces sp. NPDC006602]|uniref:hypothetical protein n=1 Tax=Streptomyces sp. NPDC006602 TaxID=3364751 RepID=UPI0036904F95
MDDAERKACFVEAARALAGFLTDASDTLHLLPGLLAAVYDAQWDLKVWSARRPSSGSSTVFRIARVRAITACWCPPTPAPAPT